MRSVGSVRTSEPTPKAVVTARSARSAAPTVIATLRNRLFIRPTAGYASQNTSQAGQAGHFDRGRNPEIHVGNGEWQPLDEAGRSCRE